MKQCLIIILFVCTSGAAAQSASPSPTPTPKPLTSEYKKIASETADALNLIRANHFAGERITPDQLTTQSMNFMLQSLDPHSKYLDIDAAEDFKSRMNAHFFGVGVVITEMLDAEGTLLGTFVKEVLEGGPAQSAGLRFGDEIVEVGGASVKGKGRDEVRSRLIGALGSKVVVVVDRGGERIANEFVRAAIPTPAIPDAYLIRPGVAYVAMNNMMTLTAHAEFRAALAHLRSAGMISLVLDLRNNGGGAARQACLVVSEFLPRGETIFHSRGRAIASSSHCVSANENPDLTTPVVVMINRYSASATEILAAGFQDTDRAVLVGEGTFGKGLMQNVMELEGGRRIHLTTSRLVTPTGRMIQRYFWNGGSLRSAAADMPAFKTRTGRVLYGGVGVVPDEAVRPTPFDAEVAAWSNRLTGPVYAFTRELVTGRLPGLQKHKLDRPADLLYDLKGDEFPISAELFAAFKAFAAERYRMDAAALDRDRPHVERLLRNELIVAA